MHNIPHWDVVLDEIFLVHDARLLAAARAGTLDPAQLASASGLDAGQVKATLERVSRLSQGLHHGDDQVASRGPRLVLDARRGEDASHLVAPADAVRVDTLVATGDFLGALAERRNVTTGDPSGAIPLFVFARDERTAYSAVLWLRMQGIEGVYLWPN